MGQTMFKLTVLAKRGSEGEVGMTPVILREATSSYRKQAVTCFDVRVTKKTGQSYLLLHLVYNI